MANGCYDHPNMLGIPGEDLPHASHYYTEPHEFYRKNVVIVGGKNSAAEAALDLYRTGAHVTLVHRQAELGASIKYWVRPDIENRIKEGSIAARFETHVVEIRPTEVVVERGGTRDVIPADGVFLLTGYLADLDFSDSAGSRSMRRLISPPTTRRHSRPTFPACFWLGPSSLAPTGARFSSRTVGSTDRWWYRRSRSVCVRASER